MSAEIHRPAAGAAPAGVDDAVAVDAEAVAALVATLDPADSRAILFFGSKVQHRLSRISRKMLATVAEDKIGQAGGAVDDMLAAIRGFDFRSADPNVKPPWWKRWWPGARPLPRLLASIKALSRRVEQSSLRLEREKTRLLTDVVTAGKLDEQCTRHLTDLDAHLEAARQVLNGSGAATPELVQRVSDLTVTRQIGQQARASLLLVQQSTRELIARVNFLLTGTVPAWQQHMAQLVAIWRRRKAADALGQAREIGQDLAAAGQRLRAARDRVRHALREGVYDLAAIGEANQELAAALEDGQRLAASGRKARARARALLAADRESEKIE